MALYGKRHNRLGMKLEKVAIKSKEDHATMTGGAHFHAFRNIKTGEKFFERTTVEHHAMMKMKGGSVFNPAKPGHIWLYTFGTNEYDTPDGTLEVGQYADDGLNFVCRFPNTNKHETHIVEKQKLKNDVIADSEVAKIRARTF